MPKKRSLSLRVPGSPDAVSRALKEQTRFQLVPSQGTVFADGKKPLAGHVGKRGFKVALNQRDWFTLTQAVAQARLTAEGDNTRVDGIIGLPAWVVWALRMGFVLGVLGVGAGAALLVTETGGMPPFFPLLIGVVMTTLTLGLGWNVAHADSQIDELDGQLRAALGQASAAPQGVATEEEEGDLRRREAAARAASRGRV